jgi:hypothetical protein
MRAFARAFGGLRALMVPCQQQVDRRHYEQREQRADTETRGDCQADVEAADRARAGGQQQRHHGDNHRHRGHQDRSQTNGGRPLHRLALAESLGSLQLVGEFDNQDTVLGNQADQRDQAWV